MTVIFETIRSKKGETMQPLTNAPRPRGRPRGFKIDQALDAAVHVFWQEGYNGASIDRLCRETEMPRASLYQEYGGKEGLFLAAIAHYVETRLGPVAQSLGPVGTLEEDLTAFFEAVVTLATLDSRTPGCLISCVLAEVAGANGTFRQELKARFAALEDRIAQRLEHDGIGVEPKDQTALAGMLAAIARGIMLRARSGASSADLHPIAEAAVQCAIARGR